MKTFTISDYKKAIKGAGPKTTQNILDRAFDALQKEEMTWEEFKSLHEYAEIHGFIKQ